jgi:hypothetical protein
MAFVYVCWDNFDKGTYKDRTIAKQLKRLQLTLYAAPVPRGVITLIGRHNDVHFTKRIDENT